MNPDGNNVRGKIVFEMLSDWHVGTGFGIPGGVDAMIARDSEGFPCLPAKTVVGMWRDAVEILARGLDNNAGSDWQDWTDLVFGNQPNQVKNDQIEGLSNQNRLRPLASLLSIEPARYDKTLRDAVTVVPENTRLKQAFTFVKPNTAIDRANGAAEDKTLRFTEMGRIGSILSCDFSLDLTDLDSAQRELVLALLTAGAGFVERIGGGRRRGAGRCKMLVDCDVSDPVEVLDKYKIDPLPHLPDRVEKDSEEDKLELPGNDDSAKWKRIDYSLRLETPVAVVKETLGNVSESFDFIPGTYLLPHITKTLGQSISKYISSGDLQVSAATIEVGGGRGLPVPKVLWHHKTDGGFERLVNGGFNGRQEGMFPTVYNKLTEREKVEDLTYQKKNFREGYVSHLGDGSGQLPSYETTKTTLVMHSTVEDRYQRPTSAVGGVYSRNAIRAGQTLHGEIRFKASIEIEVKGLQNQVGSVRLGTSKKDDYGLAELEMGQIEDLSVSVGDRVDRLVVYLESDLLIRNQSLGQSNMVDDLKAELEKELGPGTLKCTNESLIEARRIESWHVGWGLPRPTMIAMAAGSVAVFDILTTVGRDALVKLANSGIGERRGEGYGRIRFNPKILINPMSEWKMASSGSNVTSDASNAVSELKEKVQTSRQFLEFIQTIELAVWRDGIARAVVKIADNFEERKRIFGFAGRHPGNSQIGGLRSTISRMKNDGSNRRVVIDWLGHLNRTDNRRDKWKEGFGRIEQLFQCDGGDEVWSILFKGPAENDGGRSKLDLPPRLVSSEDEIKRTLWAEAVKSLFFSCARAHILGEWLKSGSRQEASSG